jgi:hypothetical protein
VARDVASHEGQNERIGAEQSRQQIVAEQKGTSIARGATKTFVEKPMSVQALYRGGNTAYRREGQNRHSMAP